VENVRNVCDIYNKKRTIYNYKRIVIDGMADIKKFSVILAKHEGGFVNDPYDKGGATNKGVTLSVYQSFYGKDKTAEDLKKITDEQYNHILKVGYWDKCKADYINNQSLANIFVDMAYNSGCVTAIKKMQGVIGVVVDGLIGTKTLNAINNGNQESIFNKFKQVRIDYYNNIVKRNPTQKKFLNGWLKRVNSYKFQN